MYKSFSKLTFNLTYLCWPRDESTRHDGGLSRNCRLLRPFLIHNNLAKFFKSTHEPQIKDDRCSLIISKYEIDWTCIFFDIFVENIITLCSRYTHSTKALVFSNDQFKVRRWSKVIHLSVDDVWQINNQNALTWRYRFEILFHQLCFNYVYDETFVEDSSNVEIRLLLVIGFYLNNL